MNEPDGMIIWKGRRHEFLGPDEKNKTCQLGVTIQTKHGSFALSEKQWKWIAEAWTAEAVKEGKA